MSRHKRRDMIDRGHGDLSVVRQCELLDISRSSVYYNPVQVGEYELELMGLIDRQYLQTPFYGSRKMAASLSNVTPADMLNGRREQILQRRKEVQVQTVQRRRRYNKTLRELPRSSS